MDAAPSSPDATGCAAPADRGLAGVGVSGPARFRAGLLLFLAGLAPLAVSLRTIATPDVWMRLAVGRHIATEGIPRTPVFLLGAAEQDWTHPSWLYDRLLYGLWTLGGAPLVILIHAALVGGSFAWMLRLSVRRVPAHAAALACIAAAWIWLPVYRVGPIVPGLFMASVFMALLSDGSAFTRRVPWLIPLQILWANVSPTFLLGPLLAALAWMDARAERNKGTARRPGFQGGADRLAVVLIGGLLAATLVTPYFLSTHRAVFDLLSRSSAGIDFAALHPMAHWFPPPLFRFVYLFGLIVCALGILTYKGRLPWMWTGPAFAAAFASFRDPGALPFFAVLSLPFFGLSLHAAGIAAVSFFRRPPHALRPAVAGPVIALLAVLSTALIGGGWADRISGHGARPGFTADESLFPARSLGYLSESAPRGPIFTTPIDSGYLVWHLPDLQVYSDLRPGGLFRARTALAHRMLEGDKDAMAEIDRLLAPSTLVISCLWPGGSTFVRIRMEDPSWTLDYFDGVTAVLTRRTDGDAQRPIDSRRTQQAMAQLEAEVRAAQSLIEQGKRPSFSPRFLGAALLFSALEQDEAALKLLDILERTAPHMRFLHILRGVSLCKLGRYEEAVPPLLLFIRKNPKHRQAWFWLAQAYNELGRTDEARNAEARSR